MKQKIFKNNLLVGILVMLLCAVLFGLVLFGNTETQAFDQLETELTDISHGMELSGKTYLTTLETSDRITWVGGDGTVLYDNEADPASMENHRDREEIDEALREGSGRSTRWSDTLLTYCLYAARLQKDGTILRVSCTQNSILALFLSLIWPTLILLVILAGLCALLSYQLARRIVKPINQVDLNHPRVDETYPELGPLSQRIREQNQTIGRQMDELKQAQREFTALTSNMLEGFLLLDDEMNILSANETAIHILGGGQHPSNLRQDCAFPPVFSAAEEALTGVHAETIQKIEDRSWQILASPILVHGQAAGAALLFMDVTEREQREGLRQEFSANVSHELKTPLTSISGFAELMSDGLVSPEKITEFSRDIYNESQRLISLVDDIIRISRLDENVAFEEETVDLYDLCSESLEELSSLAKEQQVSLSLTGEHVCIEGVRQILGDLVFNLCVNAVKYNRTGGSVTVFAGLKEDRVTLIVRDTGIGIPYAEQSRVFERFYRVDKSHSKSVGGTGLGLSIVKHAAEYHHARLTLNSVPEEGTEITVVF